ncbi:N-acetylmuramoyl-L-alanine amidase [Clostridium isatidis]|uniref:N-acetylmuramoyl-L-alanine amidase n=1 Tax=Clostridium isatidis TaxID=182773 RepID=A0A343JCR0_9CLOT|nr:N-acetylmuramoyl-L-alanine amidase [Clostridium isatidis]ASW43318.1 N-acetylmuramoyl-L-alanine amidase [Clostridium isatidis]
MRKYYYIFMIILLSFFPINQKIEQENQDYTLTQEVSLNFKEELKINDMFLPNENSRPREKEITHVMIHFMSNVSINYKDPYNIYDIYDIFLDYGVSAHYVIGRYGEIYSMVPEDRVAYHAGQGSLEGFPDYENKMNDYSIGIELLAIGTKEEMLPMISAEQYDLVDQSLIGYTDAQYNSLNLLIENILKDNPSIIKDRKHFIGHDEYSKGVKTDPGSLFDWKRIGL